MLGISGQKKFIQIKDSKDSVQQLPKLKGSKLAKKTAAQKKQPKCKENDNNLLIKPSSEASTASCAMYKTTTELAKERLALPPDTVGDTGYAKVKFNHYNKTFPVHNGILKWSDIDEDYCLSFVYRGDFKRMLHNMATSAEESQLQQQVPESDETGNYFINIANKGEYRLEVIEDPDAGVGADGLRLNSGPITAGALAATQQPIKSTSRAMDTITAELKSIAVADLNGAHAKDLLERRDLEDILFSG